MKNFFDVVASFINQYYIIATSFPVLAVMITGTIGYVIYKLRCPQN